MSDDTNSDTECGDPAPSAGVLGLGKIMSPSSSPCEEEVINGETCAVGNDSWCTINC